MTTEQPQPTTEAAGGASDVERVVRHDKRIILGDFFVHQRTGQEFVCTAITHRDDGTLLRKTVIELVPNCEVSGGL